MTAPIMPGCEPFSASGGPHGALVLHGFTGNPQSMRGLAEAMAAAGFATELPLLPGHGTAVEDMIPTRWSDWCSSADKAFTELSARCDKVVVVGLSMGGTLACRLAADHPEVAGLVLVNPLVQAPDDAFFEVMRSTLEQGVITAPGVGSDIAKPGVKEAAYEGTPIAPALSLFEAARELEADLGRIGCPVLVFTSRQDHVVQPVSSEVLAAGVAGPVEQVWLDRSYHVATLDYDAEDIEARAVAFAKQITGG